MTYRRLRPPAAPRPPRREPVEHTPEDHLILGLRILRAAREHRQGEVIRLNTMGMYHDTLDAEMMFQAQRIRSYTFPVDMTPVVVHGLGVNFLAGNLFGGCLPQWKTLNLDHFA